MVNKHNPWDLKQMQSLSLQSKIIMTQQRIRAWYDYWDGQVYICFSGGKDSTVLKHIIDSMYDDVPSLFVNTGLEYPEVQNFVREIKKGKYDCFSTNVEIVKPEMRFDEVIKKYGYPVISKPVAHSVGIAKRNPNGKVMQNVFNPNKKGTYAFHKWKFLLDAPFDVSDHCCNIMKKKPSAIYAKETGRKPILGTMANESKLRYHTWLKHGCNSFEKGNPSSQPLSFWTEQDILEYIITFNVPYASVYGEIVINSDDRSIKTTGCNRTGCIFCCFGCHLEKKKNQIDFKD